MGLGLCCQPSKWSVTEAVSEPRTFSCCNKSRFMTSFWYMFWLEMKTFYERWIFKCVIWSKIEKKWHYFSISFQTGPFFWYYFWSVSCFQVSYWCSLTAMILLSWTVLFVEGKQLCRRTATSQLFTGASTVSRWLLPLNNQSSPPLTIMRWKILEVPSLTHGSQSRGCS